MIGAAAVQRDYGAIEDAEIVERVRAGDRELFEVLMRRYNQRLFRVARAVLGDDARAEEAVQEAYLRAYTQLAQLASGAAFGAWVTRITVREACTRRRRDAREASVEAERAERIAADADAPIPLHRTLARDPETAAAQRQLRQVLETAIEELPEGAREVFVLRELEELSSAETAECLGITDSAVRVRLHRARAHLRAVIEREIGVACKDIFAFAGARCDRIVRAVLAMIAAGPRAL
ncbi:MAG: RNA polymerase sigma factor [Myxococcales bacterium]|nr:RNA polymerase sigma factor [Myxococcales bacterium]